MGIITCIPKTLEKDKFKIPIMQPPLLVSQFLNNVEIQEYKNIISQIFSIQENQNINLALASFRSKFLGCELSKTILGLYENIDTFESHNVMKLCYEPLLRKTTFMYVMFRRVAPNFNNDVNNENILYSIEFINEHGDQLELQIIVNTFDKDDKLFTIEEAIMKPSYTYMLDDDNKQKVKLHESTRSIKGELNILRLYDNNAGKGVWSSPLNSLVFLIYSTARNAENVKFCMLSDAVYNVVKYYIIDD